MKIVMTKIALAIVVGPLLAGSMSGALAYAQGLGQGSSQTGSSQGNGSGSSSGSNQSGSQGGGQSPMVTNPYLQGTPSAVGAQIVIPGQAPSGGAESNVGSIGAGIYYPDIKTYVIEGGDLINVRLYSVGDFLTTLRLSADGTGQLPLIGTVKLGGLTIEKAQQLIEDKLKSAGMYRNPQITITLGEPGSTEPTVTLAGELHGEVPIHRYRTLSEVLSASGGLPLGASPVISIIRKGVDEPIVVDVGTTAKELAKANIPLEAHDTIFIQHTGAIYLVGAFKATGLFPMQPGRTTLMQMAALSGGPLYAAKYEDMRIIRTTGTERTEVKVDINKVLYGKAPDPILQSGDIIFLPTSALKAAISSGGLGTLIGFANLAAIVATR